VSNAEVPPARRPRFPKIRLNSRWKVAAVVLVLLIIVGLFSARGLAGFYVDVLWFDSVGRAGMFWHIFWVKVVLAASAVVIFGVLAYASIALADRLAPTVRMAGP